MVQQCFKGKLLLSKQNIYMSIYVCKYFKIGVRICLAISEIHVYKYVCITEV